jgi:hypothetical protein
MFMQVGKEDVFERKYMEKFRVFASDFGEFVQYERDREARDIGLHLTHKSDSGKERLSSAFCWFQLKGIMKNTLSEEEFLKSPNISLSLRVEHLRYWYLQTMPTHLVVYVESVDTFLVLNINDYISEHWGNDILTLEQETATVTLSKQSVLDEQAFNIILARGDLKKWAKILNAPENEVRICRRDYQVIYRIGMAKKRKAEHQLRFIDWQTKTRGEIYIEEKPLGEDSEWEVIREHWQFMLSIGGLEDVYPYINLSPIDNDEYDSFYSEEDDETPIFSLKNGSQVYGNMCGGEFIEYKFNVRLNYLGKQMFEWIKILKTAGIITITPDKESSISVAPWHHRAV